MQLRKALLVSLVATVASVGAYGVVSRSSDREITSPDVRADRGAGQQALERRIARLEAEALAARSLLSQNASPTLPEVSPSTAEGNAEGDPDSVIRASEHDDDSVESERRVQKRVEEAFEAEPRDPRWAAEAESKLHYVLRSPAVSGVDVLASGCAATLCRLELQMASLQAYNTFDATWLAINPLGDGEATWTRSVDEQGRPIVVMYMTRPGHTLPKPAADED